MKRQRLNSRSVARLDTALISAVFLALLVWVGWEMAASRDALVVWSCGGNYEFLKRYAREFERAENCRVRYTAAPVQYLLDLAVTGDRVPDVIVGRGGPGWVALKKLGKLASGPTFFAIDPLVIAVASGNPLNIRVLHDLGRSGVRVARSGRAMRPKGKVPSLLMAAVDAKADPGLTERWENNVTASVRCGRSLLEPVIRGEADAALAPRSLLHYPGSRGRLDFVAVPPATLLTMRKGRGSMPQCAAVLGAAGKRGRDELASRFVHGMKHSTRLLADSGYLPLDDPQAAALSDLLEIVVQKDMPAWQVALAEALERYEVRGEARRRYLKVVYTFGPNHYAARSLFLAGRISADLGARAAARRDWQRTVAEFPPPKPCEFDSPVLGLVRGKGPVEPVPYEHWIAAAATALAETRSDHTTDARAARDAYSEALFPVSVTDGDPPKNGKREFALGLHLLLAGDLEFATRDLLKVVTLRRPSRHTPDALYLLGVCALRRGLPRVAKSEWQQVVREYPDTPAAAAARERLQQLTADSGVRAKERTTGMPAWNPAYATHVQRGMTYGMSLYEHGLPLFAFKEMAKLIAGVYGRERPAAEARYRAGVAAAALGNPTAAALQWSLCAAHFPESPWAERAARALADPSGNGAPAPAPDPGPPAPVPKGSPAVRLRIAEEFRRAGVLEGDQVILEYLKVLTVARPKPGEGDRVLARARLGLADSLERTGRTAAAREQWRLVGEKFPGTPWATQASKRLGPETADPTAGKADRE